MFLEEVDQPNGEVVQQGIDLVNDIYQQNYVNQLAASTQNDPIA